MGEFFIIAKYQGKGIAARVAKDIFSKFNGFWEILVIPENKRAILFWRKVIGNFTHNNYVEKNIKVDFDKDQHNRIILTFKS